MKPWLPKSVELIKKIEKESQRRDIKSVILKYKGNFKKISDMCIKDPTHEEKSKEYLLNMKKKIYNEKIKEPIWYLMYLDLLEKLSNSPTAFHQASSVLIIFPRISETLGNKG